MNVVLVIWPVKCYLKHQTLPRNRERERESVCVRKREMCVCKKEICKGREKFAKRERVCRCVWERERERERERFAKRESFHVSDHLLLRELCNSNDTTSDHMIHAVIAHLGRGAGLCTTNCCCVTTCVLMYCNVAKYFCFACKKGKTRFTNKM